MPTSQAVSLFMYLNMVLIIEVQKIKKMWESFAQPCNSIKCNWQIVYHPFPPRLVTIILNYQYKMLTVNAESSFTHLPSNWKVVWKILLGTNFRLFELGPYILAIALQLSYISGKFRKQKNAKWEIWVFKEEETIYIYYFGSFSLIIWVIKTTAFKTLL